MHPSTGLHRHGLGWIVRLEARLCSLHVDICRCHCLRIAGKAVLEEHYRFTDHTAFEAVNQDEVPKGTKVTAST
jgi:hypothetical protein